MTINHLTLKISRVNFSSALSWYLTTLAPIGYVQMIKANDHWYGLGPKGGFPHFWLQALDENQAVTPTHVAFDAPSTFLIISSTEKRKFWSMTDMSQHNHRSLSFMTLDCKLSRLHSCEIHLLTLWSRKAGGVDNGQPGIRKVMSRQPYYAAFLLDPDGNNIEAVCLTGKA